MWLTESILKLEISGWEGQQCSLTCPLGTYGENCSKTCDCINKGSCDPVTGKCTCGPGHYGEKCEKTCSQGYHGMDCVNFCACVGPHVEGCDPETGKCICKPGFRGNLLKYNCLPSHSLLLTLLEKTILIGTHYYIKLYYDERNL